MLVPVTSKHKREGGPATCDPITFPLAPRKIADGLPIATTNVEPAAYFSAGFSATFSAGLASSGSSRFSRTFNHLVVLRFTEIFFS